ncbi:MAG: peptidoglycan DD-metalloendopeptidase family protein [Desulfovermiculus sp.]|nr:peptidoglycan DD-metalloendopeptidase family protein [Desulfovermiculus sp.]
MPLNTRFFRNRRIRLKRPRRMRVLFPLVLCALVLVLAAISLGKHFVSTPDQEKMQTDKAVTPLPSDSRDKLKASPRAELDLRAEEERLGATHKEQQVRDPIRIVEKTVQPGQTITGMLSDFLNPADVYALNREAKEVFPLRKIKAGQPFRLKLQEERLQGFEYEIDTQKKLCVDIDEGQFKVTTQNIEYDGRTMVVDGTVRSSLFKAVTDQGEAPVLAIKLADIFAWDIDFIRDIREDDSFRLVVEKRYRKEEFSGYGPIVAAQFTNQGRAYQAFLFSTQDGRTEYFNAQGQAVRKAFLKAPLNFTRISSGYTHRRKHPILNVVRPHLGIDYAAPRGTPVKSVADGVVIARAYERGGGNYIKIRHPNGYITLYMHLSKFRSGIRKGVKVSQGQTIGYVGSTGLSTGPHLDYRVKKNGSYINPLKIDSQPASPVPEKEMARFQQAISPLQAVLEGKNPLYAQSEDPPSATPPALQF